MRKEIYNYIISKRDLHRFLREQPIWFKILTRDPGAIKRFEKAAMKYYKKTIPDRVERVSMATQMASMMLSMFQAMNETE